MMPQETKMKMSIVFNKLLALITQPNKYNKKTRANVTIIITKQEDSQGGASFEILPNELVEHILTMLPPTWFVLGSFVCSRWRLLLAPRLPPLAERKFFAFWAAREGRFKELQWARNQGCPWAGLSCDHVARGGHLEVFQWVRSQGLYWGAWTCALAAYGGHLELLQWARGNGCPWDAQTCAKAARGGHLELLKWARGQGSSWSEEWTCAKAAKGGHLEVLQWLDSQGCSWDAQTCAKAALGGHLEVLQWRCYNG